MSLQVLDGGMTSPATDAAFAFRALMNVMARPGQIEQISQATGPAPLSTAAATVLLTLCDADTRLYLAPSFQTNEIQDWLAFHTGAPMSDPDEAVFALGHWAELLPLHRFPVGTPEYPDRSTTLIVEMDDLSQTGAILRGPGIQTQTALNLPDKQAFQDNAKAFPLGLDFIFTSDQSVAALPRTTEVS